MYEQIAANKRKTALLIFGFVPAASALVGFAFNFLLSGGLIGFAIVAVIVIGLVVSSRTSTATRSRCAMSHAQAGRPARSTPATTTSSRGSASRAGCRSRGCTSSTIAAPNAFATGRNPKHAAIAVTTGLLEKMNRVELEGVLAHELSHIRNYDILVMTLAVTMVGIIALLSDFFLRFMFWGGGRRRRRRTATTRSASSSRSFGFVLLIFAPIIASLMQFAVSRQREYLADASGVQLTRYPPGPDLRAEEAEGRPHVDPHRVEGDRAPLDRGAARQGDEQGPSTKLNQLVRHAPAARRPHPRARSDVTANLAERPTECLASVPVLPSAARSSPLAALVARACGGDDDDAKAERRRPRRTTATTTTTVAPSSRRSPGCPTRRARRRRGPAVTVKIDNTPAGQPQSGVDQADVVYEEVVEGGITRLAAIFNSHAPDRVGPVRSVRKHRPEHRLAGRRHLRVLGRRAVRGRQHQHRAGDAARRDARRRR